MKRIPFDRFSDKRFYYANAPPWERLYEVQEAIRTGERAGFGLAAVSERIVLYYGPGYGLKISSTEGEGTVMEVYMAKKINRDNNSR